MALRVRTQHAADVPTVETAARRIFGQSPLFSLASLAPETEGARNAIDVLTLALWIFAAVAALAGIVAISIILSRETSRWASINRHCARLGLTRSQRVAMNGPEAVLIGSGGALLAALGAMAASPLFPIGVARRAEPSPGLHIDWAVVLLGVIVVTVVVVLISFLAALGSPGPRQSSSQRQTPAADNGPRARSTSGSRPDGDDRSVYGRRTRKRPDGCAGAFSVFGAVVGVVGVTAVIVFASSLNHIVATPRLYGATWDFSIPDLTSNTPCGGTNDFGLERQPGVAASRRFATTTAFKSMDAP